MQRASDSLAQTRVSELADAERPVADGRYGV